MTEINNTYNPSREEQHRSYGGEVHAYELNTNKCSHNSVKNIIDSLDFDNQCCRNIEKKNSWLADYYDSNY